MSIEEAIAAFVLKKHLILLSERELQFLPKSFLIAFAPDDIDYVWEKLSASLREDLTMQGFQRCSPHAFRGRTRIDGPPPRKNQCRFCLKQDVSI